MPRSVLAAVAAGALVAAAAPVHAQALTEAAMLERLDQSPAAEMLRRHIDEVRADGRVRAVLPNPSVTYAREEAAGSTDSFVSVRQDLPVPGRRGLLRAAGDARVEAAAHEIAHAHRRLRADARLAFARVLVGQAREAAVLAALDDMGELVRVLAAREREGESSAFDRRRAEREVADVRRELAAARIDLVRAAGALQRFIPEVMREGPVVGSLDAVALPALADIALRTATTRADYLGATATIEALRFERRAASRLRIPQPALMVGMKRTSTDVSAGTGYTAALELRVPLFDRGAAAAVPQAALGRAEAARAALRLHIEADVQTAHAVAAARRALVLEYEQEVAGSGADLARVARVAYEEGEQGILELLDAYRVALDGGLRVIDLRGEARAALIELDLAMGQEVTR